MTGAEAAVVAPIVGGALAGGGAAAGGKSAGGGEIPNFYKRAAGDIAASTRRAQSVGLVPSLSNFDPQGNLILPRDSSYLGGAAGGRDLTQGYTGPFENRMIGRYYRDPSGKMVFDQSLASPPFSTDPSETTGISAETKALAEAMNFFGNLYNNPDIAASLGEFRGRLQRDPTTGLVSDPLFNIIRERGTAQVMEAGRRLGGLRSTGTARGVADFLTSAEAQQRIYEDQRAAEAANALFNLNFLRGQAGFLPTQTLGSIISQLGGATQYGPQASFSNLPGQFGQLGGTITGAAARKGTTGPTTVPGSGSPGS